MKYHYIVIVCMVIMLIFLWNSTEPRGEKLERGIANHTIVKDSEGTIWVRICIDGKSFLKHTRYDGHSFQYLTIPDPNPKYSVCR